jgi:hypothetical protein
MGRTPACVAHRLSAAEQRVLHCFLAGRLPAGQVHVELARARGELEAELGAPEPQPAPARIKLVGAAAA